MLKKILLGGKYNLTRIKPINRIIVNMGTSRKIIMAV